ncbi:hypothetical protein TVAG_437340 [Trichomonas vaginalis G3]|uniref:Uncharacterized protein n=1 Tax=Trichomonas vaginalis (strain ATCC PRA-98 / G3) TaxID=412133 RepID=A2DFI0_TRIV3|nr:hypothetical protein TVAGG3_0564730 [Trichomonas vaginalis G3]EAY20908.1 hypothetical protein TVAG_437340 [Trichomonas vaginalis G3]KAI5521481.1 hypothetical protein TVAGG3_0564730 [Trichomonas vaginalis G3]|eukprot:XP_001581894.1 hypothetical protein [Trichomonas vaginalis G3]
MDESESIQNEKVLEQSKEENDSDNFVSDKKVEEQAKADTTENEVQDKDQNKIGTDEDDGFEEFKERIRALGQIQKNINLKKVGKKIKKGVKINKHQIKKAFKKLGKIFNP